MTRVQIVIPLYHFVWHDLFEKPVPTFFRIMLYQPAECGQSGAHIVRGTLNRRARIADIDAGCDTWRQRESPVDGVGTE
jgi:hypothetical protein